MTLDPIILRNKDVIEKAYEHIDIMMNLQHSKNFKMSYVLFILFVGSVFLILQYKTDLKDKFFMKKKNINEVHNLQNEITDSNENKKEYIETESNDSNNVNEINDDDLSDFEY